MILPSSTFNCRMSRRDPYAATPTPFLPIPSRVKPIVYCIDVTLILTNTQTLFFILRADPCSPLPIMVVDKYFLPSIAPYSRMVDRTRIFNSQMP